MKFFGVFVQLIHDGINDDVKLDGRQGVQHFRNFLFQGFQ